MDSVQIDHPTARRFVDALHALERDGESALEAMVALFDAQATVANAALDLAGDERAGAEGVRRFWADYCRSLAGAETAFHAVTVAPDAVGLFWTSRLAGAPPGGGYEGATLLRLGPGAGAGVVAMRGYYDTRALTPPTTR